MDSIIKNLNYHAEEINDILAAVSTKARIVDLNEVKQDVADMTNLMHDYMEEKNTKFEELEGVVNSFEGRLTNLNTAHETLSENFNTKSTEIDSDISSINENINAANSNIETLQENVTTIQEFIDTERTTLSDYGITDAKIENGIITLGGNTIEPITKHQDITGKADIATTLAGYGILDAKIEDGVITLGEYSLTPLIADDIIGKADNSKVQELEQKISDLEDKLNAAIERIAALEGTTSQEPA